MHGMYGIYQQNWVFFVFGVFQHSPSLARTHESRKMYQTKMGKQHLGFVFFSWHGHGWLASRPRLRQKNLAIREDLVPNKELHTLRIHVWYNVGVYIYI